MVQKLIQKGQRLSIETEFKPGNMPWNKGIKHSTESKLKMSQAKIGFVPWNKGKKRPAFSKEWVEKMSLSRRGMTYKNKGLPRLHLRGENSASWRGGITKENLKIRTSLESKLWREAVFKRDKFTCQVCGKIGGKLNADHIKPFAWFPELRFALDNGRTLCVDCHRATDTYGGKSIKHKQ